VARYFDSRPVGTKRTRHAFLADADPRASSLQPLIGSATFWDFDVLDEFANRRLTGDLRSTTAQPAPVSPWL